MPWEPASKLLDEEFKSLKSVSVGLGKPNSWLDAVREVVKLLAYLMCVHKETSTALKQTKTLKQTPARIWLLHLLKTFNEIQKYSHKHFQKETTEAALFEHVAALRICESSLSNLFGDQPDKLMYNAFCQKTIKDLDCTNPFDTLFGRNGQQQRSSYADSKLVVQVWKVIQSGCLVLSRSRADYVYGAVDNWLKENKDVERWCSSMNDEHKFPPLTIVDPRGSILYSEWDHSQLDAVQEASDKLQTMCSQTVKVIEAIEMKRTSVRKSTRSGIGTSTSWSASTAGAAASVTPDSIVFQYADLSEATNNFNRSRLIGEGAFGGVYKALVTHNEEKRWVAIKKLSGEYSNSAALDQAFSQEIRRVSTVRHKNIVELLGYTKPDENSPLLMVTPLHSSLIKHLYEGEQPWLNWSARLKIARGVADGLAYLHDGAPEPLVHCDIKTGNILFDRENFQAFIADFGFTRLMQRDVSTVETGQWVGTRGFVDPHYQKYCKRTLKVDVYSFGVLLLVLISGEEDVPHLVEKVKKTNRIDVDIDVQNEKSYNAKQCRQLLAIAQQCIRFEPKDRPSMSKVALMLSGDMPCVTSLRFDHSTVTLTISRDTFNSVIIIVVIIAFASMYFSSQFY
jgi:tRNA A-37 threonylcarbamoyl transferase component Bud32